MILKSKITSKGQITLPKEVRKFLNVQEGNVVIFEKENDKIVIKPAKTLRDFKGVLKNIHTEENYDAIRKKRIIEFAKERGVKTMYTFDKRHFRDMEGIEVIIL